VHPAPRASGHGPRDARRAALSTAAGELEGELLRAPVDEPFARTLVAYSQGGGHALSRLCDSIESSREEGELPALALVEAVCYDDGAARGLRAVTWVMAAQRIGETWASHWAEVLAAAREAMPLSAMAYERIQQLAMLSHDAALTADAGEREGMHLQFSRESLETVIGAATGRQPERRDMLHTVSPWQSCVVAGIGFCEARLRELGAPTPPEAR
jgi:hypothetical protein